MNGEYTVHLSDEAKDDLRNIFIYIADSLQTVDNAKYRFFPYESQIIPCSNPVPAIIIT